MATGNSQVLRFMNFNQSITNYLKTSHPRLGQLMEYNARGTLILMSDFNAAVLEAEPWNNGINAFKFKLPMDIPYVGDDNLKTWIEFKTEIEKFITKICSESLLNTYSERVFADAIKVLSEHLWLKYYEKFPYWPCVGAENKGYVKVYITHMYSSEGLAILWNCEGDVWVHDTRPNGLFRAYLCGSPPIKVILVKNSLLNALEAKMKIPSLEQAKAKVDEKLKQLTWEDL